MEIASIESLVKEKLSKERYAHSVRTLGYARELALLYNLDETKQSTLEKAALLHDIFRDIQNTDMLRIATSFSITPNKIEEAYPVLLHGKIAAAFCEQELNLREPSLIEAIRYHTTGHCTMGDVATILFIADTLEPGRTFPEAAEARQFVAKASHEDAALYVLGLCIKKQLTRLEIIAPDSIMWYNHMVMNKAERI